MYPPLLTIEWISLNHILSQCSSLTPSQGLVVVGLDRSVPAAAVGLNATDPVSYPPPSRADLVGATTTNAAMSRGRCESDGWEVSDGGSSDNRRPLSSLGFYDFSVFDFFYCARILFEVRRHNMPHAKIHFFACNCVARLEKSLFLHTPGVIRLLYQHVKMHFSRLKKLFFSSKGQVQHKNIEQLHASSSSTTTEMIFLYEDPYSL